MNQETKKEIKEIIGKIFSVDFTTELILLIFIIGILASLWNAGILGMILSALIVMLLMHEQNHS